MKPLLFLDTETHSDKSPLLIQLAWLDAQSGTKFNETYKPKFPIELGAMSIHHITNEMVENKPAFIVTPAWQQLRELVETHIVVAHNAPFDIDVLVRENVFVTEYIDTLRVARHILDIDKHNLQYLRYALNANRPEFASMSAHDALADVVVLESVFGKLLEKLKEGQGPSLFEEDLIAKMVELSKTPVLLKTMPFGKHAGKTFIELATRERKYLTWMVENMTNMEEDLAYTVNYYLKR